MIKNFLVNIFVIASIANRKDAWASCFFEDDVRGVHYFILDYLHFID